MKDSNNLKFVRDIVANERRLLENNLKYCESNFRSNLNEIIRNADIKGISPEIILVTSENMWINVKKFKDQSYIVIDTTYFEILLRLNNLYFVERHKEIATKILLIETIAKEFIACGELLLAGALCKSHYEMYTKHIHFLTEKNESTKIKEQISVTFVICHELAHVLYKSKSKINREEIDGNILSKLKQMYSILKSNKSKITQDTYKEFVSNNAKTIFPGISKFDHILEDRVLDYFQKEGNIVSELILKSGLDSDSSFIEECFCDKTAVDLVLKNSKPKNYKGTTFLLTYCLSTIYNILNLISLKVFALDYLNKNTEKLLILTLKTHFRKALIENYVLKLFAKYHPKEVNSFHKKIKYLSDRQREQSDLTDQFILYVIRKYCDETLSKSVEKKLSYSAQDLYDFLEAYRSLSSIT